MTKVYCGIVTFEVEEAAGMTVGDFIENPPGKAADTSWGKEENREFCVMFKWKPEDQLPYTNEDVLSYDYVIEADVPIELMRATKSSL